MDDMDKFRTYFAGFVTGGIIGTIFALLYAPTSGKKLRRKIGDTTENLIDEAEEFYEAGKERTEKIIKEGKKKATVILDEGKKKASDLIDDAKKKITTN
ncbi:MAG: YtxH domain-containing protein [Candidatus Bathyarchaeota archaeon]|jgi:gas vesicle protein